jgi:hypothetical protein
MRQHNTYPAIRAPPCDLKPPATLTRHVFWSSINTTSPTANSHQPSTAKYITLNSISVYQHINTSRFGAYQHMLGVCPSCHFSFPFLASLRSRASIMLGVCPSYRHIPFLASLRSRASIMLGVCPSYRRIPFLASLRHAPASCSVCVSVVSLFFPVLFSLRTLASSLTCSACARRIASFPFSFRFGRVPAPCLACVRRIASVHHGDAADHGVLPRSPSNSNNGGGSSLPSLGLRCSQHPHGAVTNHDVFPRCLLVVVTVVCHCHQDDRGVVSTIADVDSIHHYNHINPRIPRAFAVKREQP